jgi:dipeptidyl-peptidase 4
MRLKSQIRFAVRQCGHVLRFSNVVVTLFILAAAIAQPAAAQLKPETQQLFHRIFATKEFQPKMFGPARWLEGGVAYTTLEAAGSSTEAKGEEAKDIVRYATATGERGVLVSAKQLIPPGATKPLEIDDYSWSEDMARLLVFTNTKPVWRRNTRGDYWVLDRKSGALRKLGADMPESSLMFAKFSPDGSKVGYVQGNNIYVEDLTAAASGASSTGSAGSTRQLTSDGSATIVNGTSDWVYEEELSLRDAFRWSSDGKQIAYWQFDTQGVGIFPLLYNLGAPREIVTGFPYPGIGRYPSRLDIPYPIAGTTNSAVRVGVVSAAGGASTKWISVPGDPRENYIARMEWVPNSHQLAIEHLNRLQNTIEILLAEANSGTAKSIFREHDDAWLDIMEEFQWLAGGKEFLWTSDASGWRQASRISLDGAVKPITHGGFDAIEVSGIDEKGGVLYFMASPENATQRYLYRARLDGSGEAERATPKDEPGTNTYDISPDGRWAFHTFGSVNSPHKTDLVRLPGHELARVLVENSALRAKADGFLASATTEFFKLDIGDGVNVDGWMLKPAGFDPAKKYPVLVFVYGEPAAQTVLDEWSGWNFFFNRAVAAEGYVVVSFDTPGTPAPKGRAWRKSVYGAIHPVVVKNQTAAIRSLLGNRPYLDAARVGVWGWSGGGSSTLNLMFRSPDVYKLGMAVAPVPDLRLYDTIYQERYMGLPLQNVEGYKNSSAINFAEGLRGHLLIVHGSGDDNVHYSGTELLMDRLIELGKPFDFMEYPNRTHSISQGSGTTYHLYSLLLRYLEEHMPAGAVNR